MNSTMADSKKFIEVEIPIVEKIINDETWLEGERRNCWVPSDDPAVVKRVCQIIYKLGTTIREEAFKLLAAYH